MTNNLLDILSYIERQKREGYRAFFIVGPANFGKSDFAREMAEKADGHYLDLLDLFLKDQSLSDSIDTFRPTDLERLLIDFADEVELMIVDNIDFLINTWTYRLREEFRDRFLKLRSGVTRTTFCFIAQLDEVFEEVDAKNTLGQPRVIEITRIKKI